MHARVLVLLLGLALAALLATPAVDHGASRAAGVARTATDADDLAGDSADAGVGTDAETPPNQPQTPSPAAGDPVVPGSDTVDGSTGTGDSRRGDRRRKAPDCAKVRCMALTFDDGPGLPTPRLLRVLRRHRVLATFFLVGEMVDARPDVAKQIARAGHEIGVHSWNHANLTTLGPKWLTWQLRATKRKIRQVTGIRATLSRPPYGATNAAVLRAHRDAGLAEVLWNIDTSDWKIRNAPYIRSVAVQRAQRNGVVLMHDIRPTTVDAVDAMIRALKRRGYRLVTTSELIGDPQAGSSYFDWATPKKVLTRQSRDRGSRSAR